MSIESELLALMNKDGLIIAETAVRWATKNRQSDLAQQLEWDNKIAGNQFRINQVRQLIVRLKVVLDVPTKRFYSLSIDRGNKKGGGYRDIGDILKSKTLYEVLLQDALNDLERMQEQYEHLKELQPVWKEVAKVKKRKPKGDGDRPSP
jgi:flagellin-specific chaperone FliS